MFNLVEHPCHTVVEIGTQWGWWAVRAATQLPEATIWCIDPWNDPPPGRSTKGDDNFREWAKNTQECRDRIFPIRMSSKDAAPIFTDPIDFLFVDGNHNYGAVVDDLRSWVPKIRSGGLLVGHDWAGPRREGLRRAVIEVIGESKFQVDRLYRHENGALSECYWRKC